MYTPHSEETLRRWPDLYQGPKTPELATEAER
jgi:hypothetical protein